MVDQYKLLKVNRELFVHFVMAKYLGAETVTEQLDWVIGHSGVRPKEGLKRRTLNNLIMPGAVTIFFFPILLYFIGKQGLRQLFHRFCGFKNNRISNTLSLGEKTLSLAKNPFILSGEM